MLIVLFPFFYNIKKIFIIANLCRISKHVFFLSFKLFNAYYSKLYFKNKVVLILHDCYVKFYMPKQWRHQIIVFEN